MKWIAQKIRGISDFLQGKAEWLDEKDSDVKAKFSAYTSTVQKTIAAAFVIGLITGAFIFR